MYYFIVNTHARTGNSMHIWNRVQAVLEQNSVPYKVYRTLYSGHARELAEQITSQQEDAFYIIVVGGDGTVNEVLNGVSDFSKLRLGVIPSGTGNDFARNVGIKGSCEEVLSDILSHESGTGMDLGAVSWGKKCNRRIFAISSGVGFDALICKKSMTSRVKRFLNRFHLGKLSYLILTVQTLFSLKTFQAQVTVGDGQPEEYRRVIFSAAMNLRAEGGGVPMAPQADPRDGLLSVCVAADIPVLLLPFYLILLVFGKHQSLRCFHIKNDRKCYIHTNVPVTLHSDGEYLGETTDIWYECLPNSLILLNTIR